MYVLKIEILRDQFPLSQRSEEQFFVLAQFVVQVYAPEYQQSSIPVRALRLHLTMWRDLRSYEIRYPDAASLHIEIVVPAKKSLLRHLWYLSEELVAFAVFDEVLPDQDRLNVGNTLLKKPRPHKYRMG